MDIHKIALGMGLNSSHKVKHDGMVDCHRALCEWCGRYYMEWTKYNYKKCPRCCLEGLKKMNEKNKKEE